jgi:hypothetical protein
MISRLREAAFVISTDWASPLVKRIIDPTEELTAEFATFTLNTTLPESVEAKIETFPRVDELVKLVLALPLALVVAEATDSVPPLAVVTAKFTVKPDTAVPLEFVATISSGMLAKVLGVTACPLPEEMVMVEPVPLGMVFKLKTALPAVEEAMMASAPV